MSATIRNQYQRNIGLLAYYEQEAERRKAEALAQQQATELKGAETSKRIGTMTYGGASMYNIIQEGLVNKSGLLKKEAFVELADGSLNPIKLAERVPTDSHGFMQDAFEQTFTPAGGRVRIRPEVQELLDSGELLDETGKVLNYDSKFLDPVKSLLLKELTKL